MFTAWDSPEAVFQILKKLSAGMPCDITGIADYHMLDEDAGHPVALPGRRRPTSHRSGGCSPTAVSTIRTAARGSSSRNRGRPPEPPGGDFPFQLLTGRGSAAQWHTQTRTAKSDVLRKLAPKDPYVEIHPADATALGLRPRRVGGGRIAPWPGTRAARSSLRPCRSGHLFLPMHDGSTNRLTDAVFDPESRQPAYKACAARVRPSSTGRLDRVAGRRHPSNHDQEQTPMIARNRERQDRRRDRQWNGRPPVLRAAGGIRRRSELSRS